jgi:2,3-diketo-5-methylthiopentyl-1-phosphate enolase
VVNVPASKKLWGEGETPEDREQIITLPESVDWDAYIIATLFIKQPTMDPWKLTAGIALEQSTGTWARSPAETWEVREKYAARVIGLYEVPNLFQKPYPEDGRNFIAMLAFPVENIPTDVNALLTAVIGNISMGAAYSQAVKLVDLWLPKSWVKDFKGPKFGIEGIREILKVPTRPVINNMIKPCTGIPPDVHAKLFYEAAAGGVDIIKDDELLSCQKYCDPLERVVKCREAIDKANSEKGEKTLYTVNITTRGDKILELAEKAIEHGANALMLNSAAGYEALRMLVEDPSIKVPILFHPAVWGTYAAHPYAGMAYWVAAKLARLCGSDLQLFPAYYGKFPGWTRDVNVKIFSTLRTKFYHIKRSFPGAGGGIHAGMVELAIKEWGFDQQIPAGAGVHAHPMGSRAGAMSIRQAIDAVMKGIPLDEYAKDHKELKVALEKWGYIRTAEEAAKLFDLKA